MLLPLYFAKDLRQDLSHYLLLGHDTHELSAMVDNRKGVLVQPVHFAQSLLVGRTDRYGNGDDPWMLQDSTVLKEGDDIVLLYLHFLKTGKCKC